MPSKKVWRDIDNECVRFPDRFLTPNDIAARLGYHPRFIRKLIQRGTWPVETLPWGWKRVRKDVFEEWYARHGAHPDPAAASQTVDQLEQMVAGEYREFIEQRKRRFFPITYPWGSHQGLKKAALAYDAPDKIKEWAKYHHPAYEDGE